MRQRKRALMMIVVIRPTASERERGERKKIVPERERHDRCLTSKSDKISTLICMCILDN